MFWNWRRQRWQERLREGAPPLDERHDPGADVPLRGRPPAHRPASSPTPASPSAAAAIAASPSRVGYSPPSSSAFARLAAGTAAPHSPAGGGRTPSSAARDHVRDAIGHYGSAVPTSPALTMSAARSGGVAWASTSNPSSPRSVPRVHFTR